MLRRGNCTLVLIDVQEKLLPAMSEHKELLANLCRLVKAATVLELPIMYTEQYPDGLGPTLPPLKALLPGEALTKTSFSCCGAPGFAKTLKQGGTSQVLVAGIEAHVCVCQTAMKLLDQGYEVFVLVDAVASRRPSDRKVALQRLQTAGADLVSVEMAVFELLQKAHGPAFKAILKIVK